MTDRKCTDCGVPIRTASMPAAKFPGSRMHAAKGKCFSCYKANRAAPLKDPMKVDHGARYGARPTLESLMAERDAFVAARRKRGVPPEGVLRGRYADES